MTLPELRASETFELEGTGDWPHPVRGELYAAQQPNATVVICHGFKGFARWAFFPLIAHRMAESGMNALTFDFSGSGIGASRERFENAEAFEHNTWSQELSDVRRVIEHARTRGWVTGALGLLGHSRGGGVAVLHTAGDPHVRALATWSAVSSTNRWSAEEAERWRRNGYVEVQNARTAETYRLGTRLLDEITGKADGELNILAAAARVSVPWLIVHGSGDETVPVREAEALHDASREVSTLRVIPGNHTFDARHPLTTVPAALDRAIDESVGFFKEHLIGW